LNAEASGEISASEDSLLGGAIKLRQPRAGYRTAIDPVFLAAAVPAEAGETVLDAGCGVGAASLCLAKRVPDCRITGIEAQRDLVRLANENAALNGFADRIVIIAGDILRPPPRLDPGSFNHVMANPPYLAGEAATPPANAAKATATLEGEADLAAWLRFALAAVRPRGPSPSFIVPIGWSSFWRSSRNARARSWSFPCGPATTSRRSGSSCARGRAWRRPPGSPPASCCTSRTAHTPPRPTQSSVRVLPWRFSASARTGGPLRLPQAPAHLALQ
jgi:hypothetical protein